jgi:hypothetical protein
MAWTISASGDGDGETERKLFAEISQSLARAELGPVRITFEGSQVAGNISTAVPAAATRADPVVN